MSDDTTILKCHGLSTGYGRGASRHIVTSGADCALVKGSLTAFLGANGTGKSTLIRTVAGLQPAIAGYVEIAGHRVDRSRPAELARLVSIVTTGRATTAGGLTAWETVAMGRHPYTGLSGRLKDIDREMANVAMERIGVMPLAARHVASLSDGERQKVMIAKALAQDTPVLILDEPTAFLDAASRVETLALLASLAHDDGRTILLSTHDIGMTLGSADNLWLLMADGDIISGSVEQLVSDGSVGRIFSGRGVVFDETKCDFVPASLHK